MLDNRNNNGKNQQLRIKNIVNLCTPILWIGVFFLCSCENKIEKVNLLTKETNLPFEITQNVTITYSDSGYKKMKIEAPLLEKYVGDDPYTEFKEGIHVTFYNSIGEPESELTANYAIDYEKINAMEAKGNVVVINKNNEKLETEHLLWFAKDKQIKSEEFVKITTEDEIIFGDGLEANEDFTQYRIKNTKGIINIKEEEDEEVQ